MPEVKFLLCPLLREYKKGVLSAKKLSPLLLLLFNPQHHDILFLDTQKLERKKRPIYNSTIKQLSNEKMKVPELS